MAKNISFIPEPKEEYSVENQRQNNQALSGMQTQLNFSIQPIAIFFPPPVH